MIQDSLPATAPRPPLWLDELVRLLPVKSQFLLSGNIFDVYFTPTPGGVLPLSLRDALWTTLKERGYDLLAQYDPVDGLTLLPRVPESLERWAELLGITLQGSSAALEPRALPGILRTLSQGTLPDGTRFHALTVIDSASRLLESPGQLSEAQLHLFTACEKLSRSARPVFVPGEAVARFNPVVWIANREGDLPDWFWVGNERIRSQTLALPDFEERLRAARLFARAFRDHAEVGTAALEEALKTFANATEGMTLFALQSVAQLARSMPELGIGEVAEAVRLYRVGVLDNPWKKEHVRDRIRSAEPSLHRRIKGQSVAITRTLDILKRSVTGLSGAHTSSRSARPRGVLFLAGPTGVGKTELTKALTEALFGDEQAYIRFDMSEFSAEQSDQRLIGAPPGYVGYEAGGELTNAVRQRPFSVILFDEIEKAYPRILDKFLQILEDGRLTDGRGSTVYFSEAIIVFTSNLGIYVEDPATHQRKLNVTPDTPYPEVEQKVQAAIRHHFRFVLNRPEILNRIGDNVVVFDFIRPEVGRDILQMMLGNVERRVLEEHGLRLSWSAASLEHLRAGCLGALENGGRGIGNELEARLINPLARTLFETVWPEGSALRVERLHEVQGVHQLELVEEESLP